MVGQPLLYVLVLLLLILKTSAICAQTGIVQGKVTDQNGDPIADATISLDQTQFLSTTNHSGEYRIAKIPEGLYTLRVSGPIHDIQTAAIEIKADQTTIRDFTLQIDMRTLEEIVVTGTITPEKKIETSTSISSLNPEDIRNAAPRSTTEYLRRIPGFTRVESSGGEVNQNLSVRGLLGFASVNFQEDGMMVYPSMETFWMNADNLIRLDENLEKIEVLRGGTSPIFGSSTAGATVNFLNKSGGPELDGVWQLTAGTYGLARFDFNINGPLSNDWRFNIGGFYRYDHGVRDPDYPGTKGGQLKANLTRLLSNGFVRFSVKHIDDSNLFITPLPHQNPEDPEFVPGFSDTGSMYSKEGITSVPLPTGEQLSLPLDDGIKTKGTWFSTQVNFEFGEGWYFEDIARVMSVDHNWNAIISLGLSTADDYAQRVLNEYIHEGFVPESTTYQFLFTNHLDFDGNKLSFDTANGLIRSGGLIHIDKPISDFSNLLTIRKRIGNHHLAFGTHFAYYTQNNQWYFTDILTDVRDNPRFVDLVFIQPDGSTLDVTKNGFRRYPGHLNGDGNNTLIAFFTSDEFKLTDRLRIDLGLRYERANYFQVIENAEPLDLDGDVRTQYDLYFWGNGTFRRFDFDIDDVAFSVGTNYQIIPDRLAIYGSFTRGFKLPSLDEFIFEPNQDFVNAFEPYNTNMSEAGVKYSTPLIAFTGTLFYGRVFNQIFRNIEEDPITRIPRVTVIPLADSTSWGLEFEILATPTNQLELRGTSTLVSHEVPDINLTGQFYEGFTPAVFDFETIYSITRNMEVMLDWHYVATRFADTGFTRRIPDYSFINLGTSYQFSKTGFTLTGRILNLTQSKGLEELNPFADPQGVPTGHFFLARPILPRRFVAEIRYNFD